MHKEDQDMLAAYELFRIAHGNFNDKQMIFHYTSPEGVLGIAEEDKIVLHFTKFSSLNDKLEGAVLEQRFRRICDRLLKENKINSDIEQKFLKLLDKKEDRKCIHQRLEQENVCIKEIVYNMDDVFICSFTKKQDFLPMWNYYTKNGSHQGYNLGFQNIYEKCSISDEEAILQLFLYEVTYCEKDLYLKMRKVVERMNPGERDDKMIEAKFNMIFYYLFYGSLFHKNECFAHEEEVRLVFIASDSDKKNIKYKTKNGVIIPYLEIPFSKDILKKITIGPLIEQALASQNLQDFLEQKQYNDVKIAHSEVPIRY